MNIKEIRNVLGNKSDKKQQGVLMMESIGLSHLYQKS